MKLLLDTHALVWHLTDSPRLPASIKASIDDAANRIIVSAASVWEIATKVRLGKMPEAAPWAGQLPDLIDSWHFERLVVTIEHAHRAGSLPHPHKDPFDRMLVAQAIIEDLELVSVDTRLTELGAKVRW